MILSPDLVAFLSVLWRGLQLTAQSLSLGGIVFTLALAGPLAPRLGREGSELRAMGLRGTTLAGLGLAAAALLSNGLQVFALMTALDLPLNVALGADAVRWGGFMVVAGLAVAAAAQGGGHPAILLATAAAVLLASVMTGHPAARLEDRTLFMAADALHQAAAGAWIGGIPYLLAALARADGWQRRRLIGERFSRIATVAVAGLVVGALLLAWGGIGSWPALVGTAYGAMAAAKAVLLGVLLLLGLANMLAVRAMSADADPTLFRLRRFAEVEIGIGITLFFIAASLASQAPAVDQTQDRANLSEIAERLSPQWPRLTSPSHEQITLPDSAGGVAVVNQADREWSEYNHNWSGILVLLIGLLSLTERAGFRPARHWPLLFLGLAGLLLVRSDPESWPLGPYGFFERMADPEVFQHRLVILLVAIFGLFEWVVRTGRLRQSWAPLVFPLLCALGGALLLTHSHSLTDIKQRYLIELTHLPMGILGIAAGWARWLQLRGAGWPGRLAGWTWPVCFVMIGLLLLDYREM